MTILVIYDFLNGNYNFFTVFLFYSFVHGCNFFVHKAKMAETATLVLASLDTC